MGPSTFWLMKLMVIFVLLCTFIQFNNSQPVLDDDEYDAAKIDQLFAANYLSNLGRPHTYRHHRIHTPQNLDDDLSTGDSFIGNKQYHLDNLALAKRVIMLPRVGRR